MVSSELVRVLVWVLMDGTMVDNRKYIENSTKRRIQWKLSKSRKIKKLTELLNSLQIPYTLREATMSSHNVLQPYYIRIYGDWGRKIFDLLEGKKLFPDWMMRQDDNYVRAVLETLEITDGYRQNRRIIFTTTTIQYLEWLEQFCALNTVFCKRYKTEQNNRSFSGAKALDLYTLAITYD